MRGVELTLYERLLPEVEAIGVSLVDVQLAAAGKRRQILRLMIYSPQGVTHGDCSKVTRQVGEIIEAEDALPGAYVLEVSSPGLDRVLRSPREFEVFRGKAVTLWMDGDDAVECSGTADGSRGPDQVAIRDGNGDERVLDWTHINKVRLAPELESEPDAGGVS